ncbi:hypothetical protein AKO1_008115 [Acrasis kona]|uniref:MOSC domain-containing protein n=1 Tax=Acrasis kona TaxID=1008807 RepID=A0AAW2YQU6_9EUKA
MDTFTACVVASCIVFISVVLTLYRFFTRFSNSDYAARVSSIHIFPVKSVGGFTADEWYVTEYGLAKDRRWMVVKEGKQGFRFYTQRECPKLALISAKLSKDLSQLILYSENHPDITLRDDDQVREGDATREVEIWGKMCNSVDCGDQVADWISNIIGTNVRLVRVPDASHVREGGEEYLKPFLDLIPKPVNNTGFADGYPLLLASMTSTRDVRLRAKNDLDVVRFRPNIVVEGAKRVYEEDEWHTLRIGEQNMIFYNVKPCARCTIPNVNPNTGKKDLDLRSVISQYRHDELLENPIFAINLVHSTSCLGKKLKVGDKVYVEKTQPVRSFVKPK